MVFKNSFSILSRSIDTLFKMLLYSLILLLICLAIMVAIVRPILGELFDSMELPNKLQETVNTWLSGESGSFTQFFKNIAAVFSNNSTDLWKVFLIVLLFYALFKFFLMLLSIPVTKVFYRKMIESYNIRFTSAFISSLRKSLLFSLIHTLMTIVADAAILIIGYNLVKFIYPAFRMLSLTIAAFFVLILLAVRKTVLSQWVPIVVCEKKGPAVALRTAFAASAKAFKTTFPAYLMLYLLMFGLVMGTILSTLGIIPIITMAAFVMLENAVGLTAYFKANNLKYYTEEIY